MCKCHETCIRRHAIEETSSLNRLFHCHYFQKKETSVRVVSWCTYSQIRVKTRRYLTPFREKLNRTLCGHERKCMVLGLSAEIIDARNITSLRRGEHLLHQAYHFSAFSLPLGLIKWWVWKPRVDEQFLRCYLPFQNSLTSMVWLTFSILVIISFR